MRFVLLAHSDEEWSAGLMAFLESEGLETVVVFDALQAVNMVRASGIRLVLLQDDADSGAGVGGEDGTGACAVGQIRAISSVPIVVLAERDDEDVVVAALDAGADDFMVQPISARELVARARRLLHRYEHVRPGQGQVLRAGPIALDTAQRTVTLHDLPVHLTEREFMLLEVLAGNAGFVISRSELLERVWGGAAMEVRTVMTYIRRLRAKIEADPQHPRYIETVWGLGYRFSDSDGSASAASTAGTVGSVRTAGSAVSFLPPSAGA